MTIEQMDTSLPTSVEGVRTNPLIDAEASVRIAGELELSFSPSRILSHSEDQQKSKETILTFAQNYSADLASERFGVPRSTIRTWMKSENLPLKPVFNTPGQGRKISYSRELDQKLAEWVKALLLKGERITVQEICHYARGQVQQENPEFTASTGWAQRFLNRHKIDLGAQVCCVWIHVQYLYSCT